MAQNKVTAIGLGAIHRLVIAKNIFHISIWVIIPSVTAGNLHLQGTGDHLSILAIVETPHTFSVVIRVELAALQPRAAILAGLRHEGRSG